MAFSALLSAFLTNDIICLAFTPILCAAILEAKLNPVPFLIGLAAASNIGSAATIISNPQNMLLGQVGKLDFLDFTQFLPAAGADLHGWRLRHPFLAEPETTAAAPRHTDRRMDLKNA